MNVDREAFKDETNYQQPQNQGEDPALGFCLASDPNSPTTWHSRGVFPPPPSSAIKSGVPSPQCATPPPPPHHHHLSTRPDLYPHRQYTPQFPAQLEEQAQATVDECSHNDPTNNNLLSMVGDSSQHDFSGSGGGVTTAAPFRSHDSPSASLRFCSQTTMPAATCASFTTTDATNNININIHQPTLSHHNDGPLGIEEEPLDANLNTGHGSIASSALSEQLALPVGHEQAHLPGPPNQQQQIHQNFLGN